MKVIKPSYEILSDINWDDVLLHLERIARVCYKSEDKIEEGSAEKLIRMLIKRGHGAMLEHYSFSVKFICDRGVSHEMVRHRLCSFAQESTRYVNYKGQDMQFILPCWMDEKYLGTISAYGVTMDCKRTGEDEIEEETHHRWLFAMLAAEDDYNKQIEEGWQPQEARSILPNSLKTEIVVTANIRQWRKMFELRCDKTAHPQMRELMVPLWCELATVCPILFDFDSEVFNLHEDDRKYIMEGGSKND